MLQHLAPENVADKKRAVLHQIRAVVGLRKFNIKYVMLFVQFAHCFLFGLGLGESSIHTWETDIRDWAFCILDQACCTPSFSERKQYVFPVLLHISYISKWQRH